MTGFEGLTLDLLCTVVGGLVTPTNIETYISLNVDPWDQNETIDFMEPMGSFGIQTDLGDHVRLLLNISQVQGREMITGLNHRSKISCTRFIRNYFVLWNIC